MLFNNSKNPPFHPIKEERVMKRLTEELDITLVDSGFEKNTKKAVGIVRKNYEEDQKCTSCLR